MKKLVCYLCIVFSVISFQSKAQSLGSTYSTALGLKFFPLGITVKHFIAPNTSLEGIGYFWNNGFRFTGLYEFNFDIPGAPGLKFYIGPGAHIGVANHHPGDVPGDNYTDVGIDGVLGLDYKFTGAPIDISIDWQPSFSFLNTGDIFYGGWGGLGVRYTF